MELVCITDEDDVVFEEKIIHHILKNENDLLKSIIENGNDVCNIVDYSGSTLLHYAVLYRNLTMTKYLLNKGIKVDAQDKMGKTPLMLAVKNNDHRMIELLCEFKANVCIADEDGKNILQTALTTPKMLTSVIEKLLNQLYRNCFDNHEDLAEKLFQFNVPLYHAVLLGNAEITKTLLEKYNLEVNAQNPKTGERALHVAVQEKDLENVKVLLEHNAYVNARDREDRTPLFIYGVTSNCPNQKLEILKTLMDNGADCETFHWYSGTWHSFPLLSEGTRKAVRLFLKYNIDLHAKDQFDQTPIHYLALNDHPGIFEELEGRDFNVSVVDDEGYTPLHKAIGNPSSVEYLLKKGASVDALTYEDGESALFKTFARGRNKKYAKSIELLLQHNAEVQARTLEGVSILDVAVRRKRFTEVEPVLAHLALIEDSSRKLITPYTSKRIKSHDFLKKRFRHYKRQLERMKMNKLCGVVTFYELLIASEKKLAHYMRNPLLILKLIHINKKCQVNSYYINTLRKRLTEAILKARLKERAAVIISRIMGVSYYGTYAVANTIVSYLCDKDIQRLNEAFC